MATAMAGLSVIGLIWFALLWLVSIGTAVDFAQGKRLSGFGWFILGALFGPIATIFAGLAPPGGEPCGACRERIDRKARICPHCRAEISGKE